MHKQQIDHSLVIKGSCNFTLINSEWDEPHLIIYLNRAMGSLQIPIGTFRRSVSNQDGSIVLNPAIRDEKFKPENEFKPISVRGRKDLQEAETDLVYWIWKNDGIKRVKFFPAKSNKKT